MATMATTLQIASLYNLRLPTNSRRNTFNICCPTKRRTPSPYETTDNLTNLRS